MMWRWNFRNRVREITDEEFHSLVQAGQLTDAEFDDAIRQRDHALVATWSPERQIAFADQERIADQATQQRQRNRGALAQRQAASAEQRRAEREYAVGQGIRRKFFETNPWATQADFEEMWPALRKIAMLRAMDQPTVSVEAERENPRYNI